MLPYNHHRKEGVFHLSTTEKREDKRKRELKKGNIISVDESATQRSSVNCSLNFMGTKFSVRRY